MRGRPTEVRTPLGQDVEQGNEAVTRYTYSGFSATVLDPDSSKKTETMDYLGRVIQVIEHGDAGEIYTTYDYNAAGDLLTVTNALNHSTVINYDSLGRKINMDDPDMGYWQYTYDANGNLITQIDAEKQTITFGYDPLDRVTSKSYSTADSTVIYTYDDPGIDNGIGRLYRVENFQATTTIDSYDEMGRQLISTRTIIGAPSNSYTTAHAYDYSGKIVSMTYPDNYQIVYNYHPSSGLLHEIKGRIDDNEYAEITGYEPSGKIGELYHGNGVQTNYNYDTKSTRLLSIQTLDPDMADLQEKSYEYTAAGDILKITDTSGGQNITYNYGYDKLHRLVSETNTGGSDSFAAAILDKTFDDNAPVHAVKSIYSAGVDYPYQYDSNGNMTTGWDFTDPTRVASRTIEYNVDNMPVRIDRIYSGNTATINLSYGGDGRRVKKAVAGGGTTYYIGDHFEVVAGTETKYIFGGNLRIAKVTSSTKQFYHKDHLGSSTVMTSYPDGMEIETAEYLPFGLSRTQTGTEVTYYKFTDKELDAETGLYNYDARLYDPVVGIFISADSIVPDPFDSQMLNRYAYTRNNPLIYTDPTGNFIEEVGRGNHMTSEDLSRDIVDRVESGRGFDADRGQSPIADINELDSLKALYSQSLGEISNYSELGLLGKVGVWLQESNMYSEIRYRAGFRIAEIPTGGIKNLTKYGIKNYANLRKLTKGIKDLNVHHLIEKRFAHLFRMDQKKMKSIVLSVKDHQTITNKWRNAISYGKGTIKADKQQVLDTAKGIYKNSPEVFDALGLIP
jgi:RHS repeat-associated protein